MDLADAYEHNDIITDTCESAKLMMYNDVDWGSHEPVDAVNKCRLTTPKKNTKKNQWNIIKVMEKLEGLNGITPLLLSKNMMQNL